MRSRAGACFVSPAIRMGRLMMLLMLVIRPTCELSPSHRIAAHLAAAHRSALRALLAKGLKSWLVRASE